VIDRVFVSIPMDAPLQGVPANRRRNRQTIVDARFQFGGFFIVVPGYELQVRQLLAGIVEAVKFAERLQPGLPTLLAHNTVGSPRRKRIVESFICRSHRLLILETHARVVEVVEIAHPIIGRRRHDPGVTAIAESVGEAIVVLKNIEGMRA
jgi:hypothetical protein